MPVLLKQDMGNKSFIVTLRSELGQTLPFAVGGGLARSNLERISCDAKTLRRQHLLSPALIATSYPKMHCKRVALIFDGFFSDICFVLVCLLSMVLHC